MQSAADRHLDYTSNVRKPDETMSEKSK